MMSNDIPIEGVLKYIKRERDKLKNKLEILTKYTKLLEEKFNTSLKIIDEKDEEIKKLNGEIWSYKHDVKDTQLWKDIKAHIRILDLKRQEDKATISRLQCENHFLKKSLEQYDNENVLIEKES